MIYKLMLSIPQIYLFANLSIYSTISISICYLSSIMYLYLSLPIECMELILPVFANWWADNNSSLVLNGSCTSKNIKNEIKNG